ncbi:MAG: class I SAM-dependent methyltransferase [Aestuariivirga sp.]
MVGQTPATRRGLDYELGHSEREIRRLGTQARLVDPMTRRYFRDSGIVNGMRVLDIGSGAGDVAFLAAELVGPQGEVVGTDKSPAAIEAATARARERSLDNVTFRQGDPTELVFEQSFDAIVGRYVLMFNPDPAAMLKRIARHLRPGAIIVFHEVDWSGVKSSPPCPTYDRCHEWIIQTFRKVGTNDSMGLGLHSAFLNAGLPAPTMGLHALIGGGNDVLSGIDLIGDLVITMIPVMEQMGVVTAKDVQPGTLIERMRREAMDNASVVVGRSEIGAWARVP